MEKVFRKLVESRTSMLIFRRNLQVLSESLIQPSAALMAIKNISLQLQKISGLEAATGNLSEGVT